MAQRSNYWSCSKFADWLRGTDKLKAGTGDEWCDWRVDAKTKHPVRYWIAEEGLDMVQNFLWYPVDKIYDLKYYINNRWVTRTHSLTAHPRDIKPGQWCDVGNRFLPCLFNELVDYVEVELAWWHIAWNSEERAKYKVPFYAFGWFRWRVWRSPEAGLDNLKWQMGLTYNEEWLKPDDPKFGKPTPQAVAAKEIHDLYTWWTTTYRDRPDPHDASGWTAYCEKKRELSPGDHMSLFSEKGVSKALRKEGDKALKLCRKIEEQYEKEDEAMLIRLIKIRNSLWT
jgi:hypothetical protein